MTANSDPPATVLAGRLDAPPRPVARKVIAENVPAELKALPRWVGWRYCLYRRADREPIWQKEPVNPKTGWAASSKKKSTWGTFPEALGAYESGRGKLDGIGIVLSSGPDDPFDLVLIDLDIPGLEEAIGPLATYADRSPTEGKGGAHAYVWGTLPEGAKSRPREVELYHCGRYIAVTGERLGAAAVARPSPDTLAAVLAALGVMPAPEAPPPPAPPQKQMCPPRPPVPLLADDEFLLGRAFAATNGARIKALWEGSTAGHKTPSEADLALCRHLAFYWRGDEAAVDRMFRQSRLFREEKWDRPAGDGAETYRAKTVRKAVASCKGVFYTGAGPNGSGVPATGDRGNKGDGGDTFVFAAGSGAGASPSANGHAPAPAAGGLPGRLACDVTEEAVEWFLRPWFVRGMLTLLVGEMNTGKSTLLAKLASLARRVVYLPGPEEHVPAMTLHRLRAAGVDLRRVRLLDDRRYSLFDDRALVTRVLAGDGADLMVVDPVDSFFPEGWSDLNNTQTRDVLEALENVARDTKAAVVGVRHPGKVAGNVMRGAVAWGAVPRSVVELLKDAGPPVQRIIHPYKWGFPGSRPADQYFTIEGEGGRHGVFVLGGPVSPSMVEMLAATPDQLTRTQIELACDLVKRMLAEGEQEVGWMLNLGRTQGYSEPTMQRAKRLMGVTTRHDGQGRGSKHFWVPPAEWPG